MIATLRQIRAFVATAEHGGTSGAARALHVSQPSVSVAVRELETFLGSPLFQRTPPKGLSLTPFGQMKLGDARRLLADAEAFSRGGGTGAPAGPVAFGFLATLGPIHIPTLIRQAEIDLPSVTIDLVESDIESLVRLIEGGRIELALTYDVGAAGRIRTEPVARFSPYALLPEKHPLAKLDEVPIAALADQPFILIDLPYSREFILSIFQASGHSPRVAHRTGSLEMVRGLVANGLGVSLLVTKPVTRRASDGKAIVWRPIAGQVSQQAMLLMTAENARPTRPASAFADLIRRHFAKQPE